MARDASLVQITTACSAVEAEGDIYMSGSLDCLKSE